MAIQNEWNNSAKATATGTSFLTGYKWSNRTKRKKRKLKLFQSDIDWIDHQGEYTRPFSLFPNITPPFTLGRVLSLGLCACFSLSFFFFFSFSVRFIIPPTSTISQSCHQILLRLTSSLFFFLLLFLYFGMPWRQVKGNCRPQWKKNKKHEDYF